MPSKEEIIEEFGEEFKNFIDSIHFSHTDKLRSFILKAYEAGAEEERQKLVQLLERANDPMRAYAQNYSKYRDFILTHLTK